jgi:hypothetical protein
MYSLEKFFSDFIDINFDNILIEQNNKLVNSDKHYLQFKNNYVNETTKNYVTLKEILPKYNLLANNYSKEFIDRDTASTTKHYYNYINTSELDQLNNQIKEIYIKQKNIYTSFIAHLDFLNKTVNEQTPLAKSGPISLKNQKVNFRSKNF